MQARVAAQRVATRARGTLVEDILRAYDAGGLSDGLRFRPLADDVAEPVELLEAGWEELLKARSSYFGAMLGGDWLESSRSASDQGVIDLRLPRSQLERVLRFIHGAPFVESAEDVMQALECAQFFGMPSALAAISSWIATHLEVETAPRMWNFLTQDVAAAFCDQETRDETLDADDVCFEYHLKHFEALATPLESSSVVPLHDLNIALMRRLLASGLLDVPTWRLKSIVKHFVEARCAGKDASVAAEVYESLRPPAVLFNRTNRNSMLGGRGEVTARDLV